MKLTVHVSVLLWAFFCTNVYSAPNIAISDSADQRDLFLDPYGCLTEDSALNMLDKYDEKKSDAMWDSLFGGIVPSLKACSAAGNSVATYALGIIYARKALDEKSYTNEMIKYGGKSLSVETIKDQQKHTEELTTKSLGYLEQAANDNLSLALFKLGGFYEEGLLVDKSKLIAGKYYVKASKAGFSETRNKLAIRAYEKAVELVPDHPQLKELKAEIYK